MKKYIIIFAFLICNVLVVTAQTQPYNYTLQVNYKMAYQPDSTDKKSSKEEAMSLLIGREQSMYCAKQYLVMDSAITNENKKGNTFGPPMSFFMQHGTYNNQVIFKTKTEIIYYDRPARFISTFYYYIEPKPLFEWVIENDTIRIGNLICQKAICYFGNRKWIAWFTPEIPISDGPYKFCGLPGLIMKINDSQNYWNFTISSIKNIDSIIENHFSNLIPQPIKSKKEFLKQRRFSIDNRYEIMASEGAVFQTPEITKRQWEEEAKADNNWIELYK